MKISREFKIISLFVLGVIGVSSLLYSLIIKSVYSTRAITVAESARDNACVLGSHIQNNKNTLLFVSCGGFLE